MKHQTIEINKLHRDKHQPRKHFDDEEIKSMSVSIKNEGVINAIEVDENFTIVTGEQRWLAAKLAGLTEVPIKILEKLTETKRFIRQVQENIHHNTMTPYDTAEALEKARKIILRNRRVIKPKNYQAIKYIPGVKELSALFGKREDTIYNYLNLLGETGELKKALQSRDFSVAKLQELEHLPEKHKEAMKHLIVTQREIPRDTVRHLAIALRRADKYGEEDKSALLLQQKFGSSSLKNLHDINKIVKSEEDRIKIPSDAVMQISEKIVELMELFDKYPVESFDNFHKTMIEKDMSKFGKYLNNYFQSKKLLN